jgi:hypothetical protein
VNGVFFLKAMKYLSLTAESRSLNSLNNSYFLLAKEKKHFFKEVEEKRELIYLTLTKEQRDLIIKDKLRYLTILYNSILYIDLANEDDWYAEQILELMSCFNETLSQFKKVEVESLLLTKEDLTFQGQREIFLKALQIEIAVCKRKVEEGDF